MTGANLSEGIVSSKRQTLNVVDTPTTRKKRKQAPRAESSSKPDFEAEVQQLLEERNTQYPAAYKGFIWALLLSIHIWLMIGIILAWIF